MLKPKARLPYQVVSVREGNGAVLTPFHSLLKESFLHKATLLGKSIPTSPDNRRQSTPLPACLPPNTLHKGTSTLTQEKPDSIPPALEVQPLPSSMDCLPPSQTRGFPAASVWCSQISAAHETISILPTQNLQLEMLWISSPTCTQMKSLLLGSMIVV